MLRRLEPALIRLERWVHARSLPVRGELLVQAVCYPVVIIAHGKCMLAQFNKVRGKLGVCWRGEG